MNIDERIRELESIEWARVGSSKQEIDCQDADEFLRRAASFLMKRGIAGCHPFFNVAEALGIPISEEVKHQVKSIVVNDEFALPKRVSMFYLLTCGVHDAQDVYTPLLSIFKRGGSIDFHQGELVIDDEWTVSLRNWIDRFSSVTS